MFSNVSLPLYIEAHKAAFAEDDNRLIPMSKEDFTAFVLEYIRIASLDKE